MELQPDGESFYLLGVSLLAAGDAESGESALESAIAVCPDHADARVALAEQATARMELLQAAEQVAGALRSDPDHAPALRLRACLREWRGDYDAAARDFAAAALIEPDACPVPVPLDDDTVDEVVGDVLASLPENLRDYLANVPILVEDLPSPEVLADLPEAHPFELLGSFSGRSLAEGDSLAGAGAWESLPPTITVYRRNLQRFALGPTQLREELRITLLHEIGHFLGLDEDELVERGLG